MCFLVFAANAADLDFLPGWLLGDINQFHHGISHSVGMALVFALACGLITSLLGLPGRLIFWLALVLFLSHLLADYMGVDVVEPYGAPFLWPFSTDYYLASVQIFRPIEHGNPGEVNLSVFDKIFSIKNVIAICVEALIIFPFWVVTLWIFKKRLL